MRTPSIKTLSQVFDNPKKAKAILKMSRQQLLEIEACQWLVRRCYNPPRNYELVMAALNALETGVYGVENLESNNDYYAVFINTGDIYNTTVIFWQGRYRVQSIGDFIETMERQGVKFK